MKKENNVVSIMVLISILLVGIATFAMNKIIVGENNSSVNSISVLGLEKSNNGEVKNFNSILEKEDEKEGKNIKVRNQIEKELKPKVELKVETNESKKAEEMKEVKKAKEAEDVRGTTIKGTVKNANEVEYKLVKEGSVEPKMYLGKGEVKTKNKEKKEEMENIEDDEWSLDYDFSNIPQGKYELYADVKNDYGTYSSGKTLIKVEDKKGVTDNLNQNEVVVDVSKEDDSLQQSASNKLKEIQKIKNDIENDTSLTEDQKQEKLGEIEQEKAEIKTKFNFRNQAEQLFAKKEAENLTGDEKQKIQEMKKVLDTDSDGDGLPDHEEERLGTDPFSADSDQDGYLDGDEVKNGYNPLRASSGKGVDKIVFQEPKTNGEENNFYQINEVRAVKEEKGSEQIVKASISGKALPNSFITLYIYSDPIVVTVKTDEDGNWSYILDKELEDGKHEVYAAVTDNTGKITSKSPAFAFVKTAQAITPKAQAQGNLVQKQSPMEQQKNSIIIFVAVISILSLATALTSTVLLFRNYKSKTK